MSVNNVAIEIALLRGAEVAVRTFERLLPCVCADVSEQEGGSHEDLATIATHVVPITVPVHHGEGGRPLGLLLLLLLLWLLLLLLWLLLLWLLLWLLRLMLLLLLLLLLLLVLLLLV